VACPGVGVPRKDILEGRKVMDNDTGVPLFQTPDEQRRMTFDLVNRLLGTVDQWGKTQGGKNLNQMRDITLDALLKTITAICVYKELSSLGVSHKNVNLFLQRMYKEGPVEAEEPEMLLALRARKDVLLRNLERNVRAF
jgi:hypothetical protein